MHQPPLTNSSCLLATNLRTCTCINLCATLSSIKLNVFDLYSHYLSFHQSAGPTTSRRTRSQRRWMFDLDQQEALGLHCPRWTERRHAGCCCWLKEINKKNFCTAARTLSKILFIQMNPHSQINATCIDSPHDIDHYYLILSFDGTFYLNSLILRYLHSSIHRLSSAILRRRECEGQREQ